MVYLYILRSLKDNGFYIGISKDVNKRLKDHNTGKTYSTKYRKPFVIVYKESFNNYKSARIREIEIKSFKGGNEFKKLINKH